MRRFVLILAVFLIFVVSAIAQVARPARIQIGDKLSVYVFGAKDMTGGYTVQSDGAIYLPRAGRLEVKGLTSEQAQNRLLSRLKGIFTKPTATVSIETQHVGAVFVVGGKEGVLPYTQETDLRQVYASAKVEGDPDLMQVSVFRNGAKLASMSATELTSGKPGVFTGPLQANDLVVFEPKPFIRVWVIGTVKAPGRIRLNEGDDVYRAIAQAGDLAQTSTSSAEPPPLRSEYQVTIRRGPEVLSVPLVVDPNKPPVKLEDGDTVSVQPPGRIKVTLAGESKKTGEITIKPGTTLATAVSSTGGPSDQGSLKGVILFRNGEATIHDLTPNGEDALPGPVLQDGDVVFLSPNKRSFYVFGASSRPGRYAMKDTRDYRLADAVAEAGGIAPNGTLTRVSLGRADATGKLVVKTYRLDKFVRDGDVSNNPVVQPNDVVYVDTSRGITISSLTNAISAALLLQSLGRL